MDQTKQFLDTLFAGKSDGEFLLVWLLEGRRSAWFTDMAAAAAFVHENRHRDVYCGVALSPADHGPHLRLKVEGAERMPSSIVALWADIDIRDAVHKKQNLAPSVEEAKKVLFPDFPPSILIHSGGGLQAWWIFKESWELKDEPEVRKAGALATRWIRAIRARAAAKGWDIDAVGDLPRVLRIPGTSNCKIPGQPRPVQILEINDHRYNPGELDDCLDMMGAERVSASAVQVIPGEKLQYSTAAEPPFQRFQVLCDVEPKFKYAWDHLRKDLTDQSASSYDMALANMTAQAGWTDQEIANLLIAHRRRYNEDLKLRDSYYAKTIAKARATFQSGGLIREIEELLEPEPVQTRDDDGEKKRDEPAVKEDPLQKKAALTERVSIALGLTGDYRILRFIRFMAEPKTYAIEMVQGRIQLGDVRNLIYPDRLQEKIAELAGRMIPNFKRNSEWATIQQAMLDACVDVNVGEEDTNAGMVKGWLAGYLSSKSILGSPEEAEDTLSPFKREGHIHIYGPDFRKWIHINRGDRVPPRGLGVLMREVGATPDTVHRGKSTRQVWRLPDTFAPPVPADVPDWVTEEQTEEERVN